MKCPECNKNNATAYYHGKQVCKECFYKLKINAKFGENMKRSWLENLSKELNGKK